MTDSPAGHSPADHSHAGHSPAGYPPAARPMESTHLRRSDAAALADLQLHWGGAYVIGLDGDIWSATFRGTADELRAHTCLELRTLIRADYSFRQQAGPVRHEPRSADGCDDVTDQQPRLPDQPITRGERMSL